VRDELALSQLRDCLIYGATHVMDQRFRWFVSQTSATIRKKTRQIHNRENNNQQQRKISAQKTKLCGKKSSDFADRVNLDQSDYLLHDEEHINDILTVELDENEESASNHDLGLPVSTVKSLSISSQVLLIQEKILKSITITAQNNSREKKRKLECNVDETADTKIAKFNQDNSSISKDMNPNSLDLEEEQTQTNVEDTLKSDFLLNELTLQFATHNQLKEHYSLLHSIQPNEIILYDSDLEIVRQIECFQASRPAWLVVNVHFLVYKSSAEEYQYVARIAKEKKAFESLISVKEHLVVSLPDHPYDLQQEKLLDQTLSTSDSRTNSALTAYNKKRKVVVDLREFRSILPSLLHVSHFWDVLPRTLNVGDFVLTKEICVERKSIPDLFQSLASGRLYSQVESMGRYYQFPTVVIEFSPDKSFCLVNNQEITQDIQNSSIISKMVLLTLAFPNVRLLWSKTPQETVDIFRVIVASHDEVDEKKAVSVGSLLDKPHEDLQVNEKYTNEEDDAQMTAQEILLSLPGVNMNNFRNILHNVKNLEELSTLSEIQLQQLIGPVNAKKLRAFFIHQLS
jgi:ERCC4-type nuclease